MHIADNINSIRKNILQASDSVGRNPGDITLVAVTKTRTLSEIREALAAGITEIGENRLQEAEEKFPRLAGDLTYHMVGHVQSNKAKKAVELCDWIDSVDSLKIAGKINAHAGKLGKRINILLQVNISGENSKYGMPPGQVRGTVMECAALENISVRGLMTIGSLGAAPAGTREEFRRMHDMYAALREDGDTGIYMQELSMGMSGDYVTAIEEGATMVRLGTAIFGERRQG